MAQTTYNSDVALIIDRQAIVIEMLRAQIAGFHALTSMIEAQEPPVLLGALHEAVLAEALAVGVA